MKTIKHWNRLLSPQPTLHVAVRRPLGVVGQMGTFWQRNPSLFVGQVWQLKMPR